MSRSNAAAINRRVNVPAAQNGNSFKPSIANSVTQPQQPSVLTLPQVISVFDNRIMLLEKFMSEAKQTPITNTTSSENNVQEKPNFNNIEHVSINDFNTIIGEFNSRFELFAHEIADLKDIVLKLQSYTMEVNKALLDEKNKSISTVVTNNNLANTNEESLTTNNEINESIESNDKNVDSNTSIDLKNLIKQEFLQTN